MDYSKYFCPVCREQFKEDDDIVVCPDCGTPHHRKCWDKVGKCVNEDKHNSLEKIEESYSMKEKVNLNEQKKENTEEKVINFKPENKSPEEILNKIKNEGLSDPSTTFLIDGDESYLYQIAIGKNQKYYMPRFMVLSQLQKAFSFNFAAFFLPLAWSVYRKMYKAAAIILAIYIAVSGTMGAFMFSNGNLINAAKECIEEDPNFYININNYNSGNGSAVLTVKQQKFVDELNNTISKIPFVVSLGTTVLLMAVRMVMGIFANKKYMEKLKRNIRSAKLKYTDNESLKAFLYKKYGTLPIIVAVIIGIFEWAI